MFRKKVKPYIVKEVATSLVLYEVNVDIQLVRQSFEATFYYSDQPNDRYSDTAIKEKLVITDKDPISLLKQVSDILSPNQSQEEE